MKPSKGQIRQDTRTGEFWLIKKVYFDLKIEMNFSKDGGFIIRNNAVFTNLPIRKRYDKNISLFGNAQCTFQSIDEWKKGIDFLRYIKTVKSRNDLNIRKLPRKKVILDRK